MTSGSPVSRAIGVVSASDTGARVVVMPLSMTSPVTSSASGLPRSPLTKRARPIVPAAPGTLSTCTLVRGSIVASACCSARAVWSHPPPGAAGATIISGPAATPLAAARLMAAALSASVRTSFPVGSVTTGQTRGDALDQGSPGGGTRFFVACSNA